MITSQIDSMIILSSESLFEKIRTKPGEGNFQFVRVVCLREIFFPTHAFDVNYLIQSYHHNGLSLSICQKLFDFVHWHAKSILN